MEAHLDTILTLMEQLMDDYGDYLKNTAYYMLGDLQLAEDLTQETFFSFYQNHHRFRKEASYKTYLYRILMNHIKMHHRKHKLHAVPIDSVSIDPLLAINVEDLMISHIDLLTCIESLSKKDRDIIILYYFNDLSIEDISQVISANKSTVKMRLKRARTKLGALLEKEDIRYETQANLS